jgi:hypothetical protein
MAPAEASELWAMIKKITSKNERRGQHLSRKSGTLQCLDVALEVLRSFSWVLAP